MRFGIHMPQKGGFEVNIIRAKEIGCETVQFFPGNPTGWRMAAPKVDELTARADFAKEQGISPLVIHSAYLINLASSSPEFYEKSVTLLNATMERAAHYRSPYVVLHTGNHGGQGVEQGLEKIIETIAKEMGSWPNGVKLLLENTSGSGTALGSKFSELARIINAFPRGALGVCFDTAHAWGAGYDLSSEKGVTETLNELDRQVGLENVLAIHANDSKASNSSKVDRHEHIGEGQIGREGFRVFLSHCWPKDLPVVLETPEIGSDWDIKNLDTLRRLAG